MTEGWGRRIAWQTEPFNTWLATGSNCLRWNPPRRIRSGHRSTSTRVFHGFPDRQRPTTSGYRHPARGAGNPRRRGCAGSVERWYGASPQRPACPETGGVGMPTDPEIARLSKTEFLLEHTTQHQQQGFLRLQFGSRNTGPGRYV